MRYEAAAILLGVAYDCANSADSEAGAVVVNQSINVFNVLGDPTDKKFSSVNSYKQDLLPACKAFPKEITTCIWFTQSHKICNGATVLQEA